VGSRRRPTVRSASPSVERLADGGAEAMYGADRGAPVQEREASRFSRLGERERCRPMSAATIQADVHVADAGNEQARKEFSGGYAPERSVGPKQRSTAAATAPATQSSTLAVCPRYSNRPFDPRAGISAADPARAGWVQRNDRILWVRPSSDPCSACCRRPDFVES